VPRGTTAFASTKQRGRSTPRSLMGLSRATQLVENKRDTGMLESSLIEISRQIHGCARGSWLA
jgi:hypothetical protein